MGELHRRFGETLAALADTDALTQALDGADDRPEWWPVDARWKRTFGRFEPDAAVFGALALETSNPQTVVLVTASKAPDRDAAPGSWPVRLERVGLLRVYRFPQDPALPTLAAVGAEFAQISVVRYRPRKRCTLRVDGPDGVQWVKVFTDDRGAVIHRSTEALWEASRRGELDVAVAAPIRFDPATRSVWQGNVAGSMITSRLYGDEGPVIAERLGSAAASVTTITAQPELRFDSVVQMERSRRYIANIAQIVPELSDHLAAVSNGLERLHGRATGRPRPIHGAPHPEQWLDNDGWLGLIDFDRFSIGDPELDITTFQAEVDFERLPESRRDEINGAFLAGYESRAGAADPTLLLAYRVHKRLAKVQRSARALRPDGDARAARHLERVTELLARGDA
jgi:Phosphotransferase enzyme family